ncbi:MAG: hypothetical protein PUP93_00155 [Rhizonema sp. NSF051]|nr:hypothetical protein [Rhizonema sp. NSF051]
MISQQKLTLCNWLKRKKVVKTGDAHDWLRLRSAFTRQRKAKRAKIIIKGAENLDWTDTQIAENIGYFPAFVRKWRYCCC